MNARLEEMRKMLDEKTKGIGQAFEGGHVRYPFLLLAKPLTKALLKSNEDVYIPGLKIDDFYCLQVKKGLGERLTVIPVAFVQLYIEKDAADEASFFGYWRAEDAYRFEYNKEKKAIMLPNGHVLKKTCWVVVYLPNKDLGEENPYGIISYKGAGCSTYYAWLKEVKEFSCLATATYEIASKNLSNEKFTWTEIGYKYKKDLLEDSDNPKVLSMLEETMEMSIKLLDEIESGEFLPSKQSSDNLVQGDWSGDASKLLISSDVQSVEGEENIPF